MNSDADNIGHATSDVRSTLNAWRESGADRLNPVRFYFMEALDRRASGHSGEARSILDERLRKLVQAYAHDLKQAESQTADGGESTRVELAGLMDYMRSRAPVSASSPLSPDTLPRRTSYPEMEVLDYFRKTWTQVSAEKQFRQSLAQVPGNAGPLNSNSLVHRSLSLMRELSPGYLQQFLSYVDALSWMEQLNGGGTLPEKDAPRSGSPRKTTRSKAR